MADKSAIEWTEATWNPVTGCSKVSPGCAHCYAETLTERFAGSPGWIEEHRPWTPENAEHNVRLHPDRLDQPLRWRRPRMVFVNSMSDLFHEEVPDHFIAGVCAIMSEASRHTFQVLTKRPERARDFLAGQPKWRLPENVWLGVSIENARHTWRADVLRQIPAAVRFISAEPLLGSLLKAPSASRRDDAGAVRRLASAASDSEGPARTDAPAPRGVAPLDLSGIDWLIVGGESGPHARPMHPEWARELRDACLSGQCPHGGEEPCEDCQRARPAFFFKQWGSWAPGSHRSRRTLFVCSDGFTTADPWHDPRLEEDRRRDGNTERWRSLAWRHYAGAAPNAGGRLLDGREWNEMPTVRERALA